MTSWSNSEVSLLIALWGEEGVQEQLEGAKRNKHVYDKIAKQMQEKGSSKTSEQCRAKMKKLKLDYRKIKDKHNKTGQGRKKWKFYEPLDSILGHRPTTRPVMLDTSANELNRDEEDSDQSDEPVDSEVSIELSQQTGSSSSSYPELSLQTGSSLGNSSEDNSQNQASTTENANSEASPSTPLTLSTQPAQSRKRKRTKDDNIEVVLSNVAKEIVQAQSLSDTKF